MLTKYAVLFFLAGMVGGLLLTGARRYLASWYLAAATGLALLIFLPNFLWLAHHHFISYAFLKSIHIRDVAEGRAQGFLKGQFWLTDLASIPVWTGGLVGYFVSRRYRALAWMYVIPLALFFFGKGRPYYMAGTYPMLLAMGAVQGERWMGVLRRDWRWAVESVFFTALTGFGLLAAAFILPMASGGRLMRFALQNNGDLREEIGWPEMLQTVAAIRDSLPAGQRASVGIFAGNYGEAGAVEMLGPEYHLPAPISRTNSAWLRGYPQPPPSILIVLGFSSESAEAKFTGCKLAGHVSNSLGVENEESRDHPDIFVCGPPRLGWVEFWKENLGFG